MALKAPFRILLPILQTVLAVMLGGWGLWLRNQILSHPLWSSGTGWDTTARFHVWPWPFKFAVVSNMPAFLVGQFFSWPIGNRWPWLPEYVQVLPSLFFVPMLWYMVGSWLDRRWGTRDGSGHMLKTPWILLLVFSGVSLLGAVTEFTSISLYTSYVLYGVALWFIVGFGLTVSAIFRKSSSKPA